MNKPPTKRKIHNPYAKMEGYNCFGCSPNNHLGLRMEFYEEGDYLKSKWDPENHFGGYKNVLHGGIQATLLDEIASWCLQIKLKTAGVTANMNVRYRKPVYIDKGKLLLRAKVVDFKRRIVTLQTELFNANEELCCEAEIKYFAYPKEIAQEKLYFPEFEEFFKK